MANTIRFIFAVIFILGISLQAQEKFKLLDSAITQDSTVLSAIVVDSVDNLIESIPQKVKTAVAVLELDPNGVSESEARALSDRLRIEIFNAGEYEVMERDKMNRILDEMQFHLNDCTSDECAIEIGRLIGVSKIIAGSISKVGEYFTVSARLIDVETSKIEATAIEDVEGTLGIVLTQAMPSIAKKISGQIGIEIKKTVIKTAVNIITDPENSAIYINGVYRGESPMKIELDPDDYILRSVKEGYDTLEKPFTLSEGQLLDINIVLSKIVEPQVIVRESPKKKRSISKGFRVKYIKTGSIDKINNQINQINNLLLDHNQFFEESISKHNPFSTIESFNGIEVYNSSQVGDNIGFEFGLGIYRGDLDKWFSDMDKGNNESYSLVTWSPQVMMNLRFAPIRYPLFYPYIDVGFGYNLLFMNAYYNEKSLGGPMYQSWGFIYGIGFEIRPIRFFGVSIEWNRKNLDMRLMDIDEVTDNFKEYDLTKIDLTGNRVGVALNFYY
ncbi:PEGA domain-containing protein [bacterium]|nr:PEGA domain-containing protein [bacterium]